MKNPTESDISFGPDAERMARALSAAGVAWWEVDLATGDIAFDDRKATMLGYDPQDFETLADFATLVHDSDLERAQTVLDATLAGEQDAYEAEYRMRAASGEYRWLRDVGTVTGVDDDDRPQRLSGIVLDITESHRHTRGLEERGEALALLNRIVRHDLRNDLNVITGWLEVFTTDSDALTRDRLDELVTVGERAADLTENIRDVVGMIEAGDDVDTDPVNVEFVLIEEVKRARAAFPDATVELGSTASVDVVANALLSSVFRNLLNNAIEHADHETVHVTVTTETTDDDVVVSVADDGPGIPDDRKAALFASGVDDLDRLDHGLGLYLVHSLVDAYGGTVTVADNDPTGTVVSVELARA